MRIMKYIVFLRYQGGGATSPSGRLVNIFVIRFPGDVLLLISSVNVSGFNELLGDSDLAPIDPSLYKKCRNY